MAEPLLVHLRVAAGKTDVPELPQEFVPRPRLRDLLDEAKAGQVVVVTAPAGSGKTLLLADWVRRSEPPSTAWISLDADDDDPRRLWSAVVAAVTALPSTSPDAGLQRVADLVQQPHAEDLVEELADAFDGMDPPVRVVLDDVHELSGRTVLRDLTRLIRRRPAGLRLVLASRTDPPIAVPRLRLEGRLHDLRADVLRFTIDDTDAMLRAMGITLTAPQLAVLHSRTDGWAAGLRLAAIALRGTDDVDTFLTSFSGDERSIAEYLTVEILDGMSSDTQDFLRRVSVCSPLPAAVASVLSGREDADQVLDVLCHETSLVERTSPGNYRIHPLLRSYLTADLARQRPETHRQLHAVAARWWSAEEDPVHALRHAERAGDPALLAELVHEWGVVLFLSGDHGPLRRALAAVGAGARQADPWLALLAAITHLDARALAAAAVELENARSAWPDDPSAALDTLRASTELLAMTQGLTTEAHPHAPDGAEQTAPTLEALLHASRGTAQFANPRGVDARLARDELDQALELARAHDLGYLEVQSLYILATVAAVRGDLREMRSMAQQAVAAAARRGRHPAGWSAGAAGLLAYSELLAGRPAAAAAQADEALGTWDLLPPEAAYLLHAVHGAAIADQGRRPAGLAEMHAARLEFGETPAAPSTVAAPALLEHRAALMTGNGGATAEVAGWLAARLGTTGETLLLRAWTDAAAGRHDAARVIAGHALEPDMPRLLPQTPIEARLVEAEAALHAGELGPGRAALEAALAEAAPLALARPFALAGPCTQDELTSMLGPDATDPFSVQVRLARAAAVPDIAVPLSERELAVLALLPSLLSAREIAGEFTVSVNTVKSHIRSIYAKLGVSTRREAVQQAQDRGLVP